MIAATSSGGGAVILIIVFALVVMWWWSFIDALVKPTSAWTKVDKSRGAWVVLLLVFGVITSFIYFVSVRPKLKAAMRS